jgi:hypothetical protein
LNGGTQIVLISEIGLDNKLLGELRQSKTIAANLRKPISVRTLSQKIEEVIAGISNPAQSQTEAS